MHIVEDGNMNSINVVLATHQAMHFKCKLCYKSVVFIYTQYFKQGQLICLKNSCPVHLMICRQRCDMTDLK